MGMKSKNGYSKFKYALFGAAFFPFIFCGQTVAYGLTVYSLYKLANFSGGIPFSYGAQLAIDEHTGDLYVIDDTHGGVSIFNKHGMETYQFGHASNLGQIVSLAVDKDGNILILSYPVSRTAADPYYIGFCDFRGKLERKIKITGLPRDFSGFLPDKILTCDGHIYLIDISTLLVAQVDEKGVCLKTWDISRLAGWNPATMQISAFGFTIDEKGNMYFTIPTSFKAFKMTPAGKISSFGQGGDGPGKFGVASGIAVDKKGYIYVTDKLRCAVLIFDKNLTFVREFGYRGYGMGGLIVPTDLVIDREGTLYVAQGGNRGVDVFKMGYD